MNDAVVGFLVVRVGWRVTWGGGESRPYPDYRDTSDPEDRRFVPVAAFADRIAAEAFMRERELEAARAFNPFEVLGPSTSLTSLPLSEFKRRLAALAGPLPDALFDANDRLKRWRPWWDDHQPTWSDATLAIVWELFDAVRFYDILEVDTE